MAGRLTHSGDLPRRARRTSRKQVDDRGELERLLRQAAALKNKLPAQDSKKA